MSKFIKGDSRINRKGRPRGESKSNAELKKLVRDFLSGILDYDDLIADFEKLKAAERFRVRGEFLAKLVPAPFNINQMSEEEIADLANEIKQQLHDEKDT